MDEQAKEISDDHQSRFAQWGFAKSAVFAHKLLNNPVAVGRLRRKHPRVEDFFPAVLSDWVSRADDDPADEAVRRTWEALAACVEEAGLDEDLAKTIRDICPQGV